MSATPESNSPSQGGYLVYRHPMRRAPDTFIFQPHVNFSQDQPFDYYEELRRRIQDSRTSERWFYLIDNYLKP